MPFKGPDYIVLPGTEGVANLVFDVPKAARGLKGGLRDGGEDDEHDPSAGKQTEPLFEVKCVLGVTIGMGLGSKDIHLDLPVTIIQPASLPQIPPPERYATPMSYPNPYDPIDAAYPLTPPQPYYAQAIGPRSVPSSPQFQPPMSPDPTAYFSHPQSPYLPSPSPYPYSGSPPLQQLPPEQSWNHWSPPPQPLGYIAHHPTQYFSPQVSDRPYYFPPPPILYDHPPRPTSADPQSHPLPQIPRSAGHGASGLPPTSTGHLFVPLPALNAEPSVDPDVPEGEVGKGERASRISAHLRQSSRHRSVSPQSHRFPVQLPPAPPAPISVTAQRIASPISSPQNQTYLSTSPANSVRPNGEVLSPRPMLSPKNSFSVDPVTNIGSLGKSERVEELERMAVDELARKHVHNVEPVINKTLPSPPVPTGKDRVLSAMAATRPRAEEVFDLPQDEGTPKLPPQPTLTPVTSAKYSRPDYRGRESGLEALERKLLEQVGTKKPEREEGKKADVRAVLPIAIPPLKRNESDQTNDSAISSLALADKPSEDSRRKPEQMPGIQRMDKDKEPLIRERDRVAQAKDVAKNSEAHHLRKAATGRVAAWLGGIDPDMSPPQIVTPPANSPISPIRELPSVEHSLHPLLRLEAKTSVMTPDEQSRKTPKVSAPRVEVVSIPKRSSGFVLHATVKGDTSFNKDATKDATESQAETTKPGASMDSHAGHSSPRPSTNVRHAASPASTPSSGPSGARSDRDVRTSTPATSASPERLAWTKLHPSPRLPAFPPRPVDPEVKYDVRSARGGRGGKVASVAAIWSSNAQTGDNTEQSKPPAAKRPGVLNPNYLKPTSLSAKSPLNPDKLTSRDEESKARRAKMVKSTSVPALVSSSLATPVLSSTASLARPPASPNSAKPTLVIPPTISEGPSERKLTPRSEVKGEMIFGQAKLKDLIKKYQQG